MSRKLGGLFFQIFVAFSEYLNFINARPFEREGFASIPAKPFFFFGGGGGRANLIPKFRWPCRYAATETKLI